MMCVTPVNISDEKLPPSFLNSIICCTCNIYPRAVEQEEKLSSGFPTERVSNLSPQLNRLARKLKLRSKRV